MTGAVHRSSVASRRWPDLPFDFAESTAEQLADLVLEGVKALPRRGLEIGGLLLGRSRAGDFVVDALEPIHCDYPLGPVFCVGIEDLREAAKNAPAAVGMYRSRTDGVLETDEQDELLLEVLGSGGAPVLVLIIRQTRQMPAEARAGVWRKGALVWSESTVPLREWIRGELDAPAQRTVPVAPAPPRVEMPLTKAAPPPVLIQPTRPPVRAARPQWAYAAVGAVAVALVVLPIALRREAVPETGEATRARQELTPPPLETLTLPSQDPAPPVETRKAIIERREEPPSPVPPRKRAFTPPLQVATYRTAAAVDFAEAPQFRTAAMPPQVAARVPLYTYDVPAFRSVPPPPVSSPVTIASTATTSTPVSAAVHFEQPMLSRQPVPVAIPPDLRRLLRSEVTLQLKVGIDRSGSVTSVVPIGSLGRTEEALVRAYSSAVRAWVFEPAKRNGSPVNGETTLSFRVSP